MVLNMKGCDCTFGTLSFDPGLHKANFVLRLMCFIVNENIPKRTYSRPEVELDVNRTNTRLINSLV